jgi:plastocyanin
MGPRKVAFALLMLTLLALPALASAAPTAQQTARTVNVSAEDFAFAPRTITINAGDTIVWTNTGSIGHTVTASDMSFDSGFFGPGGTYSRTLDTPGTILYYCKPHGTPGGQGMAGTIVVQAASTGSAQPAQPADPTPATQPGAGQPAEHPMGSVSHVDAVDQSVINNSIVVASVQADEDGWIVIHTNTPENRPGPVIGHAMVRKGENKDVRVMLSQAPAPGDKLWPMLHVDAGRAGVYEFPGADTPVRMDGQIVMMQITVLGGSAGTTQAPAAGQPAAPRPAQLPNTGSAESTNLWMLLAGIAAVLLLGGLALGSGALRSRI